VLKKSDKKIKLLSVNELPIQEKFTKFSLEGDRLVSYSVV